MPSLLQISCIGLCLLLIHHVILLVTDVNLVPLPVEQPLVSTKDGFLNREFFSSYGEHIKENSDKPTTMRMDSRVTTMATISRRNYRSAFQKFKMKEVVHCLDSMATRRKHPIHIAFVGDSTVRNQCEDFLQLLPDYDRSGSERLIPHGAKYRFHSDVNISFPLLNDLLVSFRWRPLINNDLVADLKHWAVSGKQGVPDFLFLGSTLHHMVNSSDPYLIAKPLAQVLRQDLLPVLRNFFTSHQQGNKQIIWIQQALTLDILAPIGRDFGAEVNVKKLEDYNDIIRRIFKKTKVTIWDSFGPVAEEYIRSCAVSLNFRKDPIGNYKCNDYIHPGNVALSIGTQLLYNYMCNF